MMTLASLLADALPHTQQPQNAQNLKVTGITQDSRQVRPGYVFVARKGELHDAHRFVAKAIEQGAIATVGNATSNKLSTYPWHNTHPYILVENDKTALAKLAASFHQHPSQHLHVIGITGTDGKTTTSFLLHHLLNAAHPTSLISTAATYINNTPQKTIGHFTTPEADTIQATLAQAQKAGSTHMVLESSSHGLAMHRLDAIAYDTAVWTNLTPEHLDFHHTLEEYRNAKFSLFERAPTSIINASQPPHSQHALQTIKHTKHQAITYSSYAPPQNGATADYIPADWQAKNIVATPTGFTWQLHTPHHQPITVKLPMLGRYNIDNALAALAAAQQASPDTPLQQFAERLASFAGVPGRMQVIDLPDSKELPFTTIVDFAHTPNGLQSLLTALRPQTQGRLLVLIGAAGERDPNKRAPLGEVACKHADIAIFTEEDSRSEATSNILATMAQGASKHGTEGTDFFCVADRTAAIATAIDMAQAGDMVVFAGKGHETTLERSTETIPWDEAATIREELAKRFTK